MPFRLMACAQELQLLGSTSTILSVVLDRHSA